MRWHVRAPCRSQWSGGRCGVIAGLGHSSSLLGDDWSLSIGKKSQGGLQAREGLCLQPSTEILINIDGVSIKILFCIFCGGAMSMLWGSSRLVKTGRIVALIVAVVVLKSNSCHHECLCTSPKAASVYRKANTLDVPVFSLGYGNLYEHVSTESLVAAGVLCICLLKPTGAHRKSGCSKCTLN